MSFNETFLKLYRDSSLSGLYSNQLLKNHALNCVIISINKMFAYLQNNAINHTFMSKNNLKLRNLYFESMVQRCGLKLHESQVSFRRKFSFKNIFINSACDRPDNHRYAHQKVELAKRNNPVFVVFLMTEVLLCLRYFLNLSFYSTHARTEQKITSTRLLNGLFQVRSRPTTVTSLLNINQTQYNTDNCVRNYNQMANMLNDKFKGFILWDKHTTRISNPFINKWMLLEVEESLQLLGPEVKVVMVSISVFILFCGVLSSLFLLWKPIDIPHMVFIFDPRFCAFKLHYKLHMYLDAMRYSYMNFISTIRLHSENYAHKESKNFNLQNETKRPSIVDDLSLSYSKFSDYLPCARRQSWRKILIISQTFLLIFISSVSFMMIFWICYYQVSKNNTTIKLNSQLQALLLERPSFDLVTQQSTSSTECPKHNFVVLKHRLTEGLIMYANRSGTNIPWELLRNNMSGPEFVASRLGPTRAVDAECWLLVAISNINLSLLATTYVVAFILSIVDLSVWLIELQMKLRTCSLLVEYIQSISNLYIEDCFNHNGPLDLWAAVGDSCCDTHKKETPDQISEIEKAQCNFETRDVLKYLISSRANRMRTCKARAMRVITLDRYDTMGQRRATECFMYSTYLDIRLFENEIDLCRPIINYSITYAVFETLILVLGSGSLANTWIKIGILLFCFALSNSFLLLASFFESQCSKLVAPIFSILSMGLNTDKRLQHLALLWRKYLNDISGAHSKFVFRLFSFKVTYTTTIQVSYIVSQRLSL